METSFKIKCIKKCYVITELHLQVQNKGKNLFLKEMSNKHVYKLHISKVFTKPYVHSIWTTAFGTEINWENVYGFISKITNNRIRQFKYKLIHRITPTREMRKRWRICENDLCNVCGIRETFCHFLIDFKELTLFWKYMLTLLTNCGFSSNIKSVKNVVIGYINRLQRILWIKPFFIYWIIYSKRIL